MKKFVAVILRQGVVVQKVYGNFCGGIFKQRQNCRAGKFWVATVFVEKAETNMNKIKISFQC